MSNGEGPDFVCIGAQKAGTTWMWNNLRVQPSLWMPPIKEFHFFNSLCPHESLLGIEPRRHRRRSVRMFLREPSVERWKWLRQFGRDEHTIDWYYSLFPPEVVGDRLSGDMTPAYTTLDERGVGFARRVLKSDCRVFMIVRNPVERAWSALKMVKRWHGATIPTEDVEAVVASLNHAIHRLRGDYVRAIRLWQPAFGSNFKVFRYDQLRAQPDVLLKDVLEFLGVRDEVNLSELGSRYNSDPEQLKMPEDVRDRLRDAFREQVRELDKMVPGVADDWLEGMTSTRS